MTARRKKLLAWSDEADRALAAARARMPGGEDASDSAVVRWSLRMAAENGDGMQQAIVAGPHRLLCGDITDGAVGRLMGGELAGVIYSDPPWGPGNLQYWATMRERGSRPRTPWGDFLEAFCRVCATYRAPEAPVFVEMGLRWVDELDAAMAGVGLARRRRWRITYGPKGRPLPNTLSLYGERDVDVQLPDPPHGEPVTRAVLAAVVQPGTVVLDPCTGLGMTARITSRLGGVFRGTELNQGRLDRTVDWLRGHAS